MTRRITAAFLMVAVIYGGFFCGLTRQLAEDTGIDW